MNKIDWSKEELYYLKAPFYSVIGEKFYVKGLMCNEIKLTTDISEAKKYSVGEIRSMEEGDELFGLYAIPVDKHG